MKLAIISLIVVIILMGISGAQNRPHEKAFVWRDQIDLARLFSNPTLDDFVIIYRPSYRQTLFVFSGGRLILQSYPSELFSQSTSLLPTCTALASGADITDTLRTMVEVNFFGLPKRSFVDTGEYSNSVEFEKELKEHSIIIDDGSGRAYRAFAEGTYQGKKEKIPPAFAKVEARLIRLAEDAASHQPCPMARYMEWRRAGRGETLE